MGRGLDHSSTVSTYAGSTGVDASVDGVGTAANFAYPFDVTSDGSNFYVIDAASNTIRKIVIATGNVTTLAGTAGVTGHADGIGAAASFDFGGWGGAITTDGTNLYVVDSTNNTIRQIVISTGNVSTLAGTAGVTGGADGIGAAASFNTGYAGGITTIGGHLYVTEGNNNTIRDVVISTGSVSTLAGLATVAGSADGPGATARFNYPWGITTDGTSLYVVDTGNDTIRKLSISGSVTTIAGTVGQAASIDGPLSSALLNVPTGIHWTPSGLYITENYTSVRWIH